MIYADYYCIVIKPSNNFISLCNDKKISLRFSNDFFFSWVENLWKKESIEKHKCNTYFFVILWRSKNTIIQCLGEFSQILTRLLISIQIEFLLLVLAAQQHPSLF